jgi:hypothetical protein
LSILIDRQYSATNTANTNSSNGTTSRKAVAISPKAASDSSDDTTTTATASKNQQKSRYTPNHSSSNNSSGASVSLKVRGPAYKVTLAKQCVTALIAQLESKVVCIPIHDTDVIRNIIGKGGENINKVNLLFSTTRAFSHI